MVTRRGRGRDCAPTALDRALLGGASTSPLGVTMRTPSYIALSAAIAGFIATLVSHVFTLMHGRLLTSAMISPQVLSALLEGITLTAIIGIGTYLGARWAPPRQRTAGLAQVLGVLYFIIGGLLTFPIKTYAVAVEMPRASGGRLGSATGDFVVFSAAAILAVVIALLIARGIAAFCGGKVGGDA
jgi:hypothetical protein